MDSGIVRRSSDTPILEQLPTEIQYPADPARSYAPLPAEGLLLREYGRILKKRMWVVISTWLIIATLATVYTLHMTPVYDATGRIEVNRENSLNLGFKDSDQGTIGADYDDYNIALETQVRILQSDAIAFQVIKNLKLNNNPAFAGVAAKPRTEPPLNSLQVDAPFESSLLDSLSRWSQAKRGPQDPDRRDPLLASRSATCCADSQRTDQHLYRTKFQDEI